MRYILQVVVLISVLGYSTGLTYDDWIKQNVYGNWGGQQVFNKVSLKDNEINKAYEEAVDELLSVKDKYWDTNFNRLIKERRNQLVYREDAVQNQDDYDRNLEKNYRRNSYRDRDFYRKKYYKDAILVGLGKDDKEDNIIRPCALEDRECIRQYFAKNSKCTPTYGPISDPLTLKRATIYFPSAYLTLVLERLRINGLGNIKISEFYINKDTDNLVLALNFMNLNETTPKAYYRYKRPAKESIVLSDYTSIEFRSGTFTAVIPMIPDLRLDLAEITAFVDDVTPKIIVGPEASNSKDPAVIAAFATFLANIPTTTVREGFLFQSQLLTAIYIQENICDFGLKIISV